MFHPHLLLPQTNKADLHLKFHKCHLNFALLLLLFRILCKYHFQTNVQLLYFHLCCCTLLLMFQYRNLFFQLYKLSVRLKQVFYLLPNFDPIQSHCKLRHFRLHLHLLYNLVREDTQFHRLQIVLRFCRHFHLLCLRGNSNL